jgi:hypothetical protein
MSLTYKYDPKEKSALEISVSLLLERHGLDGEGEVYVYGGAKPNPVYIEPTKGSRINLVDNAQDQDCLDEMVVESSPKHTSFKLYDRHYVIYFYNRGSSKK